MTIDNKSFNGCDAVSLVYGDMYNALQDIMQNEDRLNELSPLDYTALGIYIGKFMEQEINSSVVQIMRSFCGIEMPEYYCRRDPYFDGNADVKLKRTTIRLNEQRRGQNDTFSLQTIPLGDAYHALEQLIREDRKGYFTRYSWLSDRIFLEAWRNIYQIRNKMAHAGEIIDKETIEKCLDYFRRFLRYMPDILKAKKELAPDEYVDSLPTPSAPVIEKEEKPYWISTDNRDKPYAPKEVAQRYCELLNAENCDDVWMNEINSIMEKYNLDAQIFTDENGKKGLKDCLGNILVPAKYDGFGFLPQPFDIKRLSVIAVRNKKYVLVTLDGCGKELTNELYDDIRLAGFAHPNPPYVFRKEGALAWGFMTIEGKILCENIIDEWLQSLNAYLFRSGDKYGYWQMGEKFLPPIYDNIEMPGEFYEPLLFTLDGTQGYVRREDASFVPLEDFKKLDEDEQNDIMWDCFCEQYDIC